MNKPKMETKDIVSENIENIAKLFPNVMTERKGKDGKITTGIDFEKLRKELTKDIVDDNDESYEFTWVGKTQAIIDANEPIRKTLRPCIEESKNFDTTENLYIEGDNLEVLKLLQESYLNQVKMIYIDPPYNTGKDSFVYPDRYTMDNEDYEKEIEYRNEEEEILFKQNNDTNPRYHSDWCSMIYTRLKLAKNLLADDGVIFISIDDNEVCNLKKIGSEIFGEGNFVGQWNWYKSATPPNLSHKIKKNIEYILCYEKNKNNTKYSGLKKESPSNDPFTKPQNTIKELNFKIGCIKTTLKDGKYEKGVYGTEKYPNELLSDLIIENGVNKNEVIFKNKFIWVQEKLDTEIENGTNIYLSDSLVLSYKKSNYKNEAPPNLIDNNVNVQTTENAGKDLELLIGTKVFDFPKPISLIKYLSNFLCTSNDIILDFFSGSSTTAHAVMQLNAEDNGNRKFIMVQIPEETDEKSIAFKEGYSNICEIGKERIRRAGQQIIDEINSQNAQITLGEEPKQLPDTGFRVLKVDSSNMKDIYYGAGEISQSMLLDTVSNVKDDRNGLDLLFSILIDWGLELSYKFETITIDDISIYNYDNGSLVACLDDKKVTEKVIKEIAKLKPMRVVFRDSCFENSASKINLEEIFKTISPDSEIKVI